MKMWDCILAHCTRASLLAIEDTIVNPTYAAANSSAGGYKEATFYNGKIAAYNLCLNYNKMVTYYKQKLLYTVYHSKLN